VCYLDSMNKRRQVAAFSVVLLATASDLHAEVMDKEPTLAHIWAVALTLGVVGAGAWRWNKWAGCFVSLTAALFAWSIVAEFTDPFVGPAILAEAGRMHVISGSSAVVTCALLHYAGAIRRARAAPRKGLAGV
jgi:hypothetical protein